MSANKLLERMIPRNALILQQLRMNSLPAVTARMALTSRPLLQASHEMNLIIDCTDRALSGQSDDAVSLKVRGAVVQSSLVGSGSTRLSIIKDPAATIYMNFNVLKDKSSHLITLVELSQRHNLIAPIIYPDVKVLAYGPTFLDVNFSGVKPDTKYAALVTYRAMHMPKCREFLNSVNLIHKPDDKMSSMVSAFVNYIPGSKLALPECPTQYKFLAQKYSFTFKQAPPGAGKTYALVHDAKKIYDDYRFDCFIIAPTNEVVLEICDRLCVIAVPHNVALSQEGLHKRLNSNYSLSTNFTVRKLQLENLKRSPIEFTMTLKAHSNIYIMTVNKVLTPKYDAQGIVPTIILWDEITLSSTCTFYSVLNKNPQYMITYGDEKQGTPYEAGTMKDDNKVLYSPINVFSISGSPYHVFLRRHVRMKGLIGDLFLRHFYDTSFDSTFHSYFPSTTSFRILTHHYFARARHPGNLDKLGHQLEKSYLTHRNELNQFYHAPGGNWLTLVPYLAEKARLDKISKVSTCPVRVLTFRPAQGQQAQNVFINFVKPRFSRFLTNTCCLVALSRFVENLVINFIPDLPKAYKDLVSGYVYRDSFSVGINYASFVQTCATNFVNKHKIADPKFGRDNLHDHNGDFFLKWWFYLAVLERISLMANKLNYCYEMTAFASCVSENKFKFETAPKMGYFVSFDTVAGLKTGATITPPATSPNIKYLSYKQRDVSGRLNTSFKHLDSGLVTQQYDPDDFIPVHYGQDVKAKDRNIKSSALPAGEQKTYFTDCKPLNIKKIDEIIETWNGNLDDSGSFCLDPTMANELKKLIFNNRRNITPPPHQNREYYCYRLRCTDGQFLTCYKKIDTQRIVKKYDPPKP
jgi:hypothetical protein